ncbi:MAG: magnesium chelatase [Saprospiraceae bacterium]|nr:magnesium chelatase [Saprospiraceae bacterium]
MLNIHTLGELKKSGYQPKSIKQELRDNLIKKLKNKDETFPGILGFEHTVIPDLERAILSRHSILLLGLRGQAKTRLARQMVNLLDPYIPIVKGSELNDDPLNPLSIFAKNLIEEKGDETPIAWLHRSERYVEKLATPDVSVADLIGDVDPILAANLKLPYSDERVIHFGLVPRANRCIFVINELPDLQARIQVSLFNILQEGDIQIRGFKLRLPLDVEFVFTANPEDYTNRGSIITPLKDRIQSQILTHYPEDLDVARAITEQESKPALAQKETISIPSVLRDLLESVAFQARESEYVDAKSGVSARLSISALENLYSSAERRMILNGESKTTARITDFWGIVPAITGKVELVYEGEQEGPYNVAMQLFSSAIKAVFLEYFPNPEDLKRKSDKDPYGVIRAWFSGGNVIELLNDATERDFKKALDKVQGLKKLVEDAKIDKVDMYTYMELALHGLAEFQVVNKEILETSFSFGDLLSGMLDDFGSN